MREKEDTVVKNMIVTQGYIILCRWTGISIHVSIMLCIAHIDIIQVRTIKPACSNFAVRRCSSALARSDSRSAASRNLRSTYTIGREEDGLHAKVIWTERKKARCWRSGIGRKLIIHGTTTTKVTRSSSYTHTILFFFTAAKLSAA